MRRTVLLACGSLALAALVACATSDGESASLEPVNDGGTAVPEAESPADIDGATGRDAGPPAWSSCNDAGWCATEFPDPELAFVDVWPFADRAFAIAESEVLGTKVLEWTESTQSWTYIDDNSQNTYTSGQYAGKMYAPSENEVYFATAPGIIYHGTRANPSSPFTWESTRLSYEGPEFADRDPGRAWQTEIPQSTVMRYATAIGVFGTSADDVYAWYGNRVFRRTSVDGGPPTWVSEFVSEDPSSTAPESFFIFGAAASSSDEVWFVGGHGTVSADRGFSGCPTLYRRTPSGYSAVLDSSIASNCAAKAGTIQPAIVVEFPGYGWLNIPHSPTSWATSVVSIRPGAALVLVNNAAEYFYFDTAANLGRYNSTYDPQPPVKGRPSVLHSVVRIDDRLWFSGHGLVFGSEIKPEAWEVGLGIAPRWFYEQNGTGYGAESEQTSVALNGRFLDEPLYQVRGTSKNNLWAVGNRYALHKKTP